MDVSVRSWWLHWAAMLALALCAWGSKAAAHEPVEPGVTEVEAAFLVNFLRYTQWPAGTFASQDAPFVITVVGPAEVADRVRAVVAAAGPVQGRPVAVRSLPWSRGSADAPLESERDRRAAVQLRSSHLVFFHDGGAALHPRVLADLWSQPVLTVGNSPGFTARGGMLGLFRVGGNIRFEANPGAIRNSRLVVSSKVLKLARSSP